MWPRRTLLLAVSVSLVLSCSLGVGSLSGSPDATPTGGPKTLVVDLGAGIKLELVRIPAGKFLMGSPDTETDRATDEGPQREVHLRRDYYLGKYEVTQEQYQRIQGSNPSWFQAADRGKNAVRDLDTRRFPVDSVSWEDAQEFLARLPVLAESPVSGWCWRLPTEAEWEYACRGGASSYQEFHFGTDKLSGLANFKVRTPSGEKSLARPVAVDAPGYRPNAFGLYHMHGNVWEWCQDWYAPNYQGLATSDPRGPTLAERRVLRGGSWINYPANCRSAARGRLVPGGRGNYVDGFRVALVAP